LCGRALEQGLIEVKEEYEIESLKKHNKKFRQLRESELLETQRVEAIAMRKQDELERRNLQVRTDGMIREETEKRLMSRL
jgi:radial spoke head protein 3